MASSVFESSPIQVHNFCSIEEFLFEPEYGRHPIDESLNPFTCGITGKTRTISEVRQLVSDLARGISKKLDWHLPVVNQWDRVIDALPVIWATHRLSGIVTPANILSSADELSDQLLRSKAKAVFTTPSLLPTALKASCRAKIPDTNVFLIEPAETVAADGPEGRFDSIQDILDTGRATPPLTPQSWERDRNDRRVAFLCFSSGTTGLPSHIYSLVLICQAEVYMGSGVVTLPSFQLDHMLSAIQKFRLTTLYLVPTIMVNIMSNMDTVAKYDFSSSVEVFIGAAPLGPEVLAKANALFPQWKILQGYGLTEAGPVVSLTRRDDVWIGSSGVPLDGVECRLVSEEGREVDDWSQPGELIVRSPALALGYLDNEQATRESFQDGWLHTGDVAVIKKSPRGNFHVFIVDRLKDLIKVKGMQVSPTELEAQILLHPEVAEAAVVGVEDAVRGEIPMAVVVPTPTGKLRNPRDLTSSIKLRVEEHKANYKWLRGGVEIADSLPKTTSGKVNRRALRDKERRKARVRSGSHL
ncbi:hypothetical protein ACJ41O_010476 [Fusarium nematophilum]